tara:strand:- start:3079 stop:3762 length:684 start_codon:yes stop_codon:yes gene_type:complete
MIEAQSLFSLPTHLPFSEHFDPKVPPWEWVPKIAEALAGFDFLEKDSARQVPAGLIVEGEVFIHPTVKLPPYAVIQGPAWIGPNTEIRPGAFIRGNVIVGESCTLGNSCEYKNCLLMDKVESAHFNYVGDSILGTGAHLGAGVIVANLRLDRDLVPVMTSEGRVQTELKKLGAMIGDYAEVGCNAVLQPGSILGKRSMVTSALPFGGHLPEATIATGSYSIKKIPRR